MTMCIYRIGWVHGEVVLGSVVGAAVLVADDGGSVKGKAEIKHVRYIRL